MMRRWTSVTLILTGIAAIAFLFDLTPWIRGGFGWRWQYEPVALGRLLPLIGLTVIYLAIASRLRRMGAVILWSMIGSIGLAIAAAYSRDGDALYTLFTRTASIVASGEWWMAASIDWPSGQWRAWTDLMTRLGTITSNAATSPPGLPMMYALATALADALPILRDPLYRTLLPYQCHQQNLLIFSPAQWAAAWIGILTPVWGALVVVPIAVITRQLALHDRLTPVIAWAIVPGMMAFSASSSTFFPLIALISMALLITGLRGSRWALIGAGLVYGIGLFANLIFLPLAALYGFYTLIDYWQVKRTSGGAWHDPIRVGIWFGLGVIVPWGIFTLFTGLTFFDLLDTALSRHLELDRPYLYWVWMHVWDWAIWTGLALTLLSLRDLRHNRLGLALWCTVLAFTLSGTTRGESGRIWLILTPFALIAAGYLPIDRRILHLQAALSVILVAVLAVYPAPELTPPPNPPQIAVTQPIDAVFSGSNGDLFRLIGWDYQVNDSDLVLRLQWQGITRPDQVQYFGAVLVGPDGTTIPVEAWQPLAYPTPCWANGAVIGVTHAIPMDRAAMQGDWYVSLAAFGDPHLPEGRLTVRFGDGRIDGQVGLGPIRWTK
ncbi:MAG: hypothetical protein MUF87_10815 [Anaerolineae bacterium]|jgi:hypothetical protein|nr:hypothetical protein [Anaerolineae bacterium]